jgi:signal transduction histidine kinase
MVIFDKNKNSIYRLMLAFSLVMEIIGSMIYIAKKGGYTNEIIVFLFINKNIKLYLQYLYITLGSLGYIISLGRYIYPLFLIKLAMSYSTNIYLWNNKKKQFVIWIFPVLSLVMYFPIIYEMLIKLNPKFQSYLALFSIVWIIIYMIISLGILVYEYVSIRLNFNKNIFRSNLLYIISMTGLYTFYCGTDPGQVYKFYSYENILNRGLGYLQYTLDINGYLILFVGNIIFGLLNIYSLLKYTHKTYIDSREENYITREFDVIKIGTSVFVHSMKNQLLANKVIYKRLNKMLTDENIDYDGVVKNIQLLENRNANVLTRIEELNNTVKFNKIYLSSMKVEEIVENAIKIFMSKVEKNIISLEKDFSVNDFNSLIEVEYQQKPSIMASKVQLSEALYNILSNAYEAIENENVENPKITIKVYLERKYTFIEIKDNGQGIDKVNIKNIFKPYFSSKNSNNNWGMGLYYTRQIVKSHFGKISVDSKKGEYTIFYISIPTYSN